MSWFNEVTGSNDYERQSWRDSYSDGKAAGDWTGNHNRRLDAERETYGATLSGSSSEPSAYQLASAGGGAGFSGGASGTAGNLAGPAAEVVTQGPVVKGRPAGGSGPASRLTISGPFTPVEADEVTQFRVGGVIMRPHPGTSNMQEVEDRWGDAEFLSPAWFASWAIAGADGLWNATGARGGSQTKEDIDRLNSPGAWPAITEAFGRQANLWDRQLHEVFAPGRPYVGGGF